MVGQLSRNAKAQLYRPSFLYQELAETGSCDESRKHLASLIGEKPISHAGAYTQPGSSNFV